MSRYKVIPNLTNDLLEIELNKAAEDDYELVCVKQDGTIIMERHDPLSAFGFSAFGLNESGEQDLDVDVDVQSYTVTPKLNPDDYTN